MTDEVRTRQPGTGHDAAARAEDEVAGICRDLIRFDTSNFGDNSGPGERAAAEYAAGLIEEDRKSVV